MDRRRLGRTSFEITPVGLGCMQFSGRGLIEGFYPPLGQETVTAVVRTALDGGVSWFDTAEMYGRGHSERALTTALRALDVAPGQVVIASKWSPGLRRASSIGRTAGARREHLQGYPLDLHQIHMPYGGLSSLRSQVTAMARLCREGGIAAVGVSNFSARQMVLAEETLRSHGLTLASNQVQINLLTREVERNGVLETARRLGVTLIAYSPLRGGLLTGRFHEDPASLRSLPRVRRVLGRMTPRTVARTAPLVEGLREIALSHGVTVAQVALAWLITFYGDTVVAIPGASAPRHARESAGAMSVRLSPAQLRRIDELSRACGA